MSQAAQVSLPIASTLRHFHVLAKPTGAICNLDCKYCFFLSKEMLYPGDRFRMADDLLEAYIRQLLESQPGPAVSVAWQGGEPTLMGLDFFRRSIEHVRRYCKPGTTVEHTIQTNGVELTDEWCEFFHEHRFLVGLSLDGPREMHDRYRVDKGGRPTFDNGDLYSCDHFVEPKHLLGNIRKVHMLQLVSSDQQQRFGNAKRDTLPRYCRECDVRFACHGECPKNRFTSTPDGEPGLNYLCAGYMAFFKHIDRPMRLMADLLRRGRYADEAIAILAAEDAEQRRHLYAAAGRNDPCPCGSGRKFKHCHGGSGRAATHGTQLEADGPRSAI